MSFSSLPIHPIDEALIKSLQKNGAVRIKAEDELFKQYQYFIREGVNRYSISGEDAFDAYADTILHAITNIRSGIFENRSSLKTYLFKIYSNKCVDLIRKKTTNKSSIHQTLPIGEMMSMIADSARTIVQELIEKTDLEVLRNKLLQLGDNCRQLLTMFADGYNDKEIATLMEYKTADVVKTSRLRCLDKLRQLYIIKKEKNEQP